MFTQILCLFDADACLQWQVHTSRQLLKMAALYVQRMTLGYTEVWN